MRQKLRKTLRILKRVFIVLLGLLFIFLIGTTIWNKVSCIKEDKALSKVGKDVKVNGRNIRVSITGKGEKTIVLLSGMGTPSPIIDFKPLADQLGKHYQVVTLEYTGYGLSDDSDEKRTNKAYVEEIRGALRQLKIKPPYILMPHSYSGIFCLQYMKSYPKEVEAMVGIDCSVPNQEKQDNEPEISNGLYFLARFLDTAGLTRLYNPEGIEYLKGMEASGSYSKEDLKNAAALVNRRTISRAQLNESRLFKNNSKELYDVKYPNNIPVLFILSDNSCKVMTSWLGLHEEVISNPDIQKIVRLKGDHYLHWTQSKAIAEMTYEFIQGKH